MSSAEPGLFDRPRIVVADEDPAVVAFVVDTLRKDGNAVFHAYDALSAVQLAVSLEPCHLLISNTRVEGLAGIDLIHHLRKRLPTVPILYLANVGRSTPEIEAQLPRNVPILREPFTADQLLAAVRPFIGDQNGDRGHPAQVSEGSRQSYWTNPETLLYNQDATGCRARARPPALPNGSAMRGACASYGS